MKFKILLFSIFALLLGAIYFDHSPPDLNGDEISIIDNIDVQFVTYAHQETSFEDVIDWEQDQRFTQCFGSLDNQQAYLDDLLCETLARSDLSDKNTLMINVKNGNALNPQAYRKARDGLTCKTLNI